MNVVFHIDDLERWPMVLANVWNLTAFYEEHEMSYTIEVVANAGAVMGYARAGSGFLEDMRNLADRGVAFVACNNTLKVNSMTAEDIFDFVSIVDAAVVELVGRQAEGYAYIRP